MKTLLRRSGAVADPPANVLASARRLEGSTRPLGRGEYRPGRSILGKVAMHRDEYLVTTLALGAFHPRGDVVIDTDSGLCLVGERTVACGRTVHLNWACNPTEARAFDFSTITIPRGVTVRAVGTRPLILLAFGPCVVDGVLDVSGMPGTGGGGGGGGGALAIFGGDLVIGRRGRILAEGGGGSANRGMGGQGGAGGSFGGAGGAGGRTVAGGSGGDGGSGGGYLGRGGGGGGGGAFGGQGGRGGTSGSWFLGLAARPGQPGGGGTCPAAVNGGAGGDGAGEGTFSGTGGAAGLAAGGTGGTGVNGRRRWGGGGGGGGGATSGGSGGLGGNGATLGGGGGGGGAADTCGGGTNLGKAGSGGPGGGGAGSDGTGGEVRVARLEPGFGGPGGGGAVCMVSYVGQIEIEGTVSVIGGAARDQQGAAGFLQFAGRVARPPSFAKVSERPPRLSHWWISGGGGGGGAGAPGQLQRSRRTRGA